MANLESIIKQRLASFKDIDTSLQDRLQQLAEQPESRTKHAAMSATHAKLKETQEAHTEYLLKTAPFIREYFKQQPKQDGGASATTDMAAQLDTNKVSGGQCTWHPTPKDQVRQCSQIFRRYMCEVERQPGFTEQADVTRQYDVCTDCEGAPALLVDREYLVCPYCARCYPTTNLSFENLSFEQQISEIVPVACYRRSNHFSEWLSKLQAREVTQIPDNVMIGVKLELKKQRLSETAKISQAKIKEILKKLKLSKFYEHVPSIHSNITHTSAPKFPQALEERLKQLFDEIQEPFERFKGAKRSNMLSYGFLLYKFCELLGEDEYLPYLPLLKSTTKLWDCDQVWKKICTDRQWEFVPTV
jgi:hypothetical protein